MYIKITIAPAVAKASLSPILWVVLHGKSLPDVSESHKVSGVKDFSFALSIPRIRFQYH